MGLAGAVQAQLGAQQAQCIAWWGDPISAVDEAGGIRTAVFSNATAYVQVEFVDGVVERLVYHNLLMEAQDIPDILTANAEGHSWDRWSAPQAAGQTDSRKRWMRSDEMAMAMLENHAMTVIGGKWNSARQAAVQPAREAAGVETSAALTTVSVLPPTTVPTEQGPVMFPALAEPRAARPNAIPAVGDARETVIRILGHSAGSLRNGNREILSYPWGCVYLTNGKVMSIE